jgi:hypothetical protein
VNSVQEVGAHDCNIFLCLSLVQVRAFSRLSIQSSNNSEHGTRVYLVSIPLHWESMTLVSNDDFTIVASLIIDSRSGHNHMKDVGRFTFCCPCPS